MKERRRLESWAERDRDHLLHPLFDPADRGAPLVWERGEGALVYSADGREFIDGLSGLWNVHVGHGRQELAAAAARQMERLAYASCYAGNSNPPAIELAEKLASIGHPSIRRFFFASGGGEANDSAIKTAWFYWQAQGRPAKRKIIAREHAYHGVTIGAMSATGMPPFWEAFGGKLAGFVHIPSPYPYRSRLTGLQAANQLEHAIVREGPDTIAAFIAEPVQGAGGVIVPQADYFAHVRQICDRHEVLLIADEVITGFGRTGRWFGLEHYGVEPDLMTMAKGLTSGYLPLSALGVSDRVMAGMQAATGKWMHAYTCSGHPVACAVALENIAIIEREHLIEAARIRGERLLAGLRQYESLPFVGEVRGLGMLAGIELVADPDTRTPFAPELKMGERLAEECRKRGLVSRFRGDMFVLAPPLVTSDGQIDRIVEIVGDALTALRPN